MRDVFRLLEQIEQVSEDLTRTVQMTQDLTHPQVLQLSRRLDELVLAAHKEELARTEAGWTWRGALIDHD